MSAPNGPTKAAADQAYIHAQAAASHISFLRPELDLLPPVMPTREEMDEVILAQRKKVLVEEYFGDEGT